MTAPSSSSAGRCPEHPDAEASAVCERCGSFVCEQCRHSEQGLLLCPACSERRANRPPSRASTVALVLATLGPLGLVPGLVGGALGWMEMRRIHRGESPATGEGYARLAQLLGILWVATLGAVAWWTLAALIE